MDGKRLLRTLRLENFLSYGPKSEEIELQPLNVLIGPNGSGKSNLLEAISLLKAAPIDITAPIRAGGGMPHWLYKGGLGRQEQTILSIKTTVDYPETPPGLEYRFRLQQVGQQPTFVEEVIESELKTGPEDAFWYRNILGYGTLQDVLNTPGEAIREVQLEPDGFDMHRSILGQRNDPDRYPALHYLCKVLSEIRLFRSCNLGHNSPLRGPQRADEPASFLLEDGRNLGVVLNELLNRPETKKQFIGRLKRFYDYIEDVTTKIVAGTVETLIHERGLCDSIPSTRLSDGTLRYLSLLTILCHPEPPPLVCIEDPEIGLHPDILPMIADLLVEASQRMQLIVTTHSDVLVSALSSVPEAVIVCERDDDGTHLQRLEPAHLAEWLEKYALGELWMMGEIGGNL